MFQKKNADQIIGYVMVNEPAAMKSLLKSDGVNADSLSGAALQKAFLKAIKDSATFRASFAEYAATRVAGKKMNFMSRANFVSQPGAMSVGFAEQPYPLDFVSQPGLRLNEVGPPTGTGSITTDTLNTTTTTTTNTSSGNSFWDKLGSAFTADTIKSVLNTGLGAVGTKIQSDANTKSEENALELERIRLAQIEAAKDVNSGPSVGTIAAIGIGLLVAGYIVFKLATKKKVS